MSYTCFFDRISTRCDMILQLKTMLKAAGWLVMSSSDGTTYNSSGDQITQSGTGAGGINNTNAWFRIRCPLVNGVNREFTLQRTNTDTSWRIKYSYSTFFTGGTPGATRTPSATDEGVVLGSGTDASPTGGILFSTQSVKYSLITVGDVSDGYTFFSHAGELDTTNCSVFYFDKITSGSMSSGDVDPYLIYVRGSAFNNVDSSYYSSGWYRKNLSAEAFLNWSSSTYGGAISNNDAVGRLGCSSTNNEKEGMLPVIYARNKSIFGTQNGVKGVSSLLLMKNSNRFNYSTFRCISNNDKICVGNWLIPWNGTFPRYP